MLSDTNAKLIDLAGSRELLESLPIAITLVDAQSRRIAYRNAEARRIVTRSELPYDGVDLAAIVGMRWPDGTPIKPHDIPGVASMERGERIKDMVFLLPCLDGSTITLSMDTVPLCDADGTILGAILRFWEIEDGPEMARRLSKSQQSLGVDDRRRRFLSLLSEATRDLEDAGAIAEVTTHLVGVHLEASRCAYGTVDVDADLVRVFRGYVDGVPSSAGIYRLSQFGAGVVERQKAGKTDVVSDVKTDPTTQDAYKATYAPMETRAFIGVPLIKNGRMVAFFTVHHREPREWTPDEIRLVEEVAERTWSTIERISSQRQASASESRYQALVEGLPQLIWASLPNGSRDYLSPQWLAYTGRRREESLDQGWLEAVHPDDRAATSRAWNRAVAEGRAGQAKFRLRRFDGEYRYFQAHVLPLYDSEGILVKWLGATTDIDDLFQAQASLEARALRQSHVAESAYRVIHALSIEEILRLTTEAARSTLGVRAALAQVGSDGEPDARCSVSLDDGRLVEWTAGPVAHIDRLMVSAGPGHQALSVDLAAEELSERLRSVGLGELTTAGTLPALIAPLLSAGNDHLGVLLLLPNQGEEFGSEDGAVLVQFAQVASAAIENVRLTGGLLARSRELERANRETFDCLARAAALRDEDTAEHTGRVGRLSRLIATEIGIGHGEAEALGRAAVLHDVGKIGIPDEILRKPGPLTPDERTMMETHAALGAFLLEGCEDSVLRQATTIALSHHERWDGEGYPQRLKGEHIPFEGRIVAVADAYDAMTKDRPYRRAMPSERARAILGEGSGTQWDPSMVAAFMRCDLLADDATGTT